MTTVERVPAQPLSAMAAADVPGILRELVPVMGRLAGRDAEAIALQRAAAAIPAPTGREDARAAWFAGELGARGAVDVRRDSAGNVVGCIPGMADEPPIVLLAHLDTVFPDGPRPVHAEVQGRLVGPGINDNARGLAATLMIASELAVGGVAIRRPVVVVGTTGEEGAGDLRGARHFFASQPTLPAAAIAIDGAGSDRIVNVGLGSRRLRIGFDGPGGHSWSAFGVANAAHAAAVCAASLARMRLPGTPRATLGVGRIGGGLSVNAIPAFAWLEVDVRSADPEALERLEREVRRAASEAAAEENARRLPGSPPLAFTIDRFGSRPSGVTPPDHPLVAAARALTAGLGWPPKLAVASTDANVPMSLGIPAIAIGGGGIGGDAHTDQEWFENVEGPRGIARALAIVVAAARS